MKLYSESARSKNLDIQCEIGADITLTVFVDEPKFRQVLSNLFSNAVKFTKQGRVDIGLSAVQGSFAAGAQTLQLNVKDTGIGLDNSAVARLFEPFTQADGSITRQFGGTGLGLTISKRLVELMGEKINASGELGKGADLGFTVTVWDAPSSDVLDVPLV